MLTGISSAIAFCKLIHFVSTFPIVPNTHMHVKSIIIDTRMEIDYYEHLIDDDTQFLTIISDLSYITGRLLRI